MNGYKSEQQHFKRAETTLETLRSSIHTTLLFSILEKNLVRPSTKNVKCSMSEVPGCSTTSGQALQYAGQRAFLAILTHNPLRSRKLVTYVTLC